MWEKNNIGLGLVVAFLLGALLGMYAYDRILAPEASTKTITEVKTEYVPVEIPVVQKEYIEVPVPKPIYLRDTIIKEVTYPINKYRGAERLYNGNLHYEIDVAGELLSYKFRPDFKINTLVPVNTITHTTTNTYYKTGWYVGGGAEVGLIGIEPFVSVSVITKKGWQLDYGYKPTTSSHLVGVKRRIF